MSKIRKSVMMVILMVVFILTTASSCDDKSKCRIDSPDTMLTVCAYEIVTGK